MNVRLTCVTLCLSLTALPLMWSVDKLLIDKSDHVSASLLLVSGVSILIVLSALAAGLHAFKSSSRLNHGKFDWLFVVFFLACFASVVDLVTAMETDGHLSGFMSTYLRSGEPYLSSPHGVMIMYWDGIVHLVLCTCMMLNYEHNWTAMWKFGLYWFGSYAHSMIVFIPGNVVGKFGISWPFLLNVPYMFMPFYVLRRFLGAKQLPTASQSQVSRKQQSSSIWSRPIDMLFVAYFVFASGVACIRSMAVLGASQPIFKQYLQLYEPYLLDPVAYPKIHMLVYLCYFLPYYVATLIDLVQCGEPCMIDWSLVHAGAAAQGQFAHIGSTFHDNTPPIYRFPASSSAATSFWIVNLSLFVVPQLFAVRCFLWPNSAVKNKFIKDE